VWGCGQRKGGSRWIRVVLKQVLEERKGEREKEKKREKERESGQEGEDKNEVELDEQAAEQEKEMERRERRDVKKGRQLNVKVTLFASPSLVKNRKGGNPCVIVLEVGI